MNNTQDFSEYMDGVYMRVYSAGGQVMHRDIRIGSGTTNAVKARILSERKEKTEWIKKNITDFVAVSFTIFFVLDGRAYLSLHKEAGDNSVVPASDMNGNMFETKFSI